MINQMVCSMKVGLDRNWKQIFLMLFFIANKDHHYYIYMVGDIPYEYVQEHPIDARGDPDAPGFRIMLQIIYTGKKNFFLFERL